MGKLLPFKKVAGASKRGPRRLEKIKEELLLYHGIDLDKLINAEPASTLTIDEFELLTDKLLETIDAFCEDHPTTTVHDILYTIENVKEIIKDTVEQGD